MYKVFFVDDEASMRTGIRESIDWDEAGFTLAGEAPDGEMALSLMQDIMPDILLTDVRMPFMDGIELARRTRKTMPWIKIVIISGHDEFEYAKQAITIGVEDYLLKPVTSGQLIETLNEIAGRIEEEKERLRNVEELIEGTRRVRAEKLLSALLYGGVSVCDALATAEELGLAVVSDHYLVMQIELHLSPSESYNYYYNACECALGVLDGWENAVFFSQGSDRVVCVLKGADPAALEEDAYTCAQAVKYEVERNGPCSVAVAIGSIVSDIEKWPDSLADADAARRTMNVAGLRQITGTAMA
ncbi:MAG: response regulator, partial [Clostridiales bacterium]|nr:response regulator [Clostridiales bacterium]